MNQKKYFSRKFQVIDTTFLLNSDIELDDLFFKPRSFNLFHNYNLKLSPTNQPDYTLNLSHDVGAIKLDIGKQHMILKADLTGLDADNFEKQFYPFGINGLINKFILSKLETDYGISTLHSCCLVSPSGKNIIMGIGSSGSGKSLLVSHGLEYNWKILSTEYTSTDGDQIFEGNSYDNVGSKHVNEILLHSPQVKLCTNEVFENIFGEKTLIDLNYYKEKRSPINLRSVNLIIAVFAKGADGFNLKDTIDRRFMLENLYQSSSEKIDSPLFINKELVINNLKGSLATRLKNINSLYNSAKSLFIVSGNSKNIYNLINKYD